MFFKRNKFGKMVDMHCHILPGIDDGAKDMEETMEMLRIAVNEGIEALIVTPHYKHGRRNAAPTTVMKKIKAVQEEANRQNVLISLFPGNEIFYFKELAEYLERGEVLSLNDTDRVLIEFSPTDDYRYIRNALDEVRSVGYIPILAHAERYECIVRDWEHVKELKNLDTEIQLNVASVEGRTGREAQKLAWQLLKNYLVDYMGTDAHDTKNRAPTFQDCYRGLSRKMDTSYLDDIFFHNVMKIIDVE